MNNRIDEFNNILSGCRTLMDAKYFERLYINSNPDMEQLIVSMVNGRRYENILDFYAMRNILMEIDDCRYKHEARNIIENIMDGDEYIVYNSIQTKALTRLANSKPYRPPIYPQASNFKEIEVSLFRNQTTVKQSCPHCGIINSMDIDETIDVGYAICGYMGCNGYDWKGCSKDFCFRCGRMFCKSWMDDRLFLVDNQIHNDECCRNHAIANNNKYPIDYCQCVDRL